MPNQFSIQPTGLVLISKRSGEPWTMSFFILSLIISLVLGYHHFGFDIGPNNKLLIAIRF